MFYPAYSLVQFSASLQGLKERKALLYKYDEVSSKTAILPNFFSTIVNNSRSTNNKKAVNFIFFVLTEALVNPISKQESSRCRERFPFQVLIVCKKFYQNFR